MKCKLTDAELEKLNFKLNIFGEYYFKVFQQNTAVFVDIKSRKILVEGNMPAEVFNQLVEQ